MPRSEKKFDGTVTEYKYDEYFNVIEKTEVDLNDKPTKVIYYTYDALNRLTSEIYKNVVIDETLPNEPIRVETIINAYTYAYDDNGNIIEKVKYDGDNVDYMDTYHYDSRVKDNRKKISSCS